MSRLPRSVSPGSCQERPTDAWAARWKTARGCRRRTKAATAGASSRSSSSRGGAAASPSRARRWGPAKPAAPVTSAEPLTDTSAGPPGPRPDDSVRPPASRKRSGFADLLPHQLLLAHPVDRATDSLAHPDLRLPPEQLPCLLDRGPAPLHVDLEAREVLELEGGRVLPARLPYDPRDVGDRELLGRGDVEVLVLSRRAGHRRDDAVGDVVDVRERARLLSRAEDLERALPREDLADQVGYGVGDARLGVGQLAGAVGVEGTADREGQAVLLVERAAVLLARQLREPVGRAGDGADLDVLLRGRELRGAFEDHRGGHVDEPLHPLLQRCPEDRVVERVVDLEQRVREVVEVADAADDRREVDDVVAARPRSARLLERPEIAGVHLARLAHPLRRLALVGDAHLEVRVTDQPAHHRGADGARAAGDENPLHVRTVSGRSAGRSLIARAPHHGLRPPQ